MFYIIALIGFFIALISPGLGGLFLITALGKYFLENQQRTNHFFVGWLVLCGGLYLLNQLDKIQALNVMIGTGLSCFLLFVMIKKEYGLNLIFMILLLLNSAYIALRQLLFYNEINTQYNEAVDEAVKLVSTRFQENSEQYQVFIEITDLMRNFYLQYSPGVWIATIMLCLTIGYFSFARKREELHSLSEYQTDVFVVYSLVIALIVALFTDYKLYAVNYLIALSPLFLMQGIGVVNNKIGKWFLNSKILIAVAILSMIINPYIVLFISALGLFDCWFDFRNLNKPEDLNENHSNRND